MEVLMITMFIIVTAILMILGIGGVAEGCALVLLIKLAPIILFIGAILLFALL